MFGSQCLEAIRLNAQALSTLRYSEADYTTSKFMNGSCQFRGMQVQTSSFKAYDCGEPPAVP